MMVRIDAPDDKCFNAKFNSQSLVTGTFDPEATLVAHVFCYVQPQLMNADTIVKLIEEMVDLKVHQQAEAQLHPKPEFARLLEEKRFADRRRLELIKQELARLLGQPQVKIVERK